MPSTARARAPAVVCVGSELPPYTHTAGTLTCDLSYALPRANANLDPIDAAATPVSRPGLRRDVGLGIEPCGSPVNVGDFADVRLIEQDHQHPAEAEPKPAMGRTSVLEEVQVELDGLHGQPLLSGLRPQDLIAVFALGAGRHLHPLPQKVNPFRDGGAIRVAHVVEAPHLGRVVGHKHKLMPEFPRHMLSEESLARGVEVSFALGNVPPGSQNPQDILHGYSGKWHVRYHDIDVKGLTDPRSQLFFHPRECVLQPALLKRHDVFMGLDPRHFHIHTRELRGVAWRKRWIGPKCRTDFKDTVEPRSHRHLLVELR